VSAPDTSGVNEDLLRRVLTYITEHPDEHDQAVWAARRDCGTACCVAGHVVVMSGYELDWSFDDEVTCDVVGLDDTIGTLAARLLNLTGADDADTASFLFAALNTLDDLWRIAAELTDGRVSRPTTNPPTK
jgi:hypothetical protein